MKKHVWIVIVVVLFFIGLIIAFSLTSPDQPSGGTATSTEKSN